MHTCIRIIERFLNLFLFEWIMHQMDILSISKQGLQTEKVDTKDPMSTLYEALLL